MEKVEVKTKQIEDRIHHFYCDDCDAYIGASQEYDDGWRQELGKFELKILMPRGWYKLEKCLCEKCREKFLDKVYTNLEFVGFKPH
jgi:uncharacterized protein YlaI